MPRRTRTKPQRFVAGEVAPKPTAKETVRTKTLRKTPSRSVSVENDEGHCIRGRKIPPSTEPVPLVLREIHQLQSSTKLQIPKLPFARLIREVLLQYTGYGKDFRITAECLECLQEAAEIYLVQVFEDSNKCCKHRDRVVLCTKDIKLALFLRDFWR